MLRHLLRPFWIALALLFLFEAWLWEKLQPLVGRIVDALAWPKLKLWAAARIEALPPAATLAVFAFPVLLLLPLKFLGLWMLAHGSWLGALAVLGLAKVVSMGLTAFIFDVTRPKLLQLAWFRWIYVRVLVGLAWAHRQIDPVKAATRAWVVAHVAPVLRRLRTHLWAMQGSRRGRFLRRLARLRRRMQRA